MKDKRIGNDISVVWTLMRDGAPFNISGLPVTLYLRNMYGKTEIEDFTVSKNQVNWTFYGKDQKQTGKYSLVLVVNEDKEGMLTTDACDFVNLVSCSCKVGNGADECGVQTESIELTTTLEYVAGSGTISIEIDSELSEESTNPVENRVITGELAKKVNKSDLATINGQRIDEGGNIEIEGGGSTPDLSGYLTKEEFNKASEDFATTDALEGKQDTIEDLNSIRSGAEKGATAVQPSILEGYATTQQLTELSAEVGKKVDSDKVATINGQSLVQGGNITIVGGEKGEKGDKGDKGDQGNSGYTGAADELEVVNNLTQGGATAALSAEMGKVLNENAGTWNGAIVETFINLIESWDTSGARPISNYIKVTPGETYTYYIGTTPAVANAVSINQYNSNKELIKSQVNGNRVVAEPNAAFLRVEIYSSNINSSMIIEGDYVPTKYISHEDSRIITTENDTFNFGIANIVKEDVLPNTIFDGERIAVESVPINANNWIGITRNNIVDNSTNLPQTTINATTGATQSYQYGDCSDFTPVRSGKKYLILKGADNVYFYDKDKKYIKVSTNRFGNYVTIPNDVAFIRFTMALNSDSIICESDDIVDLSKENTLRFWQNKDEFFDNMVENLANVGSKVLVGRPYNLLQYQIEGTETNGVFSALAGIAKYISNKIKGEKAEYTFTEEKPYNISILEFEVLRYDAEDTFLGKQTYKGVRGFTLTEDCEYFRMKINNNESCLIRGGVEDVQGYRDKDTLSVEFRNDDYRKQIMSDMLKYPNADKLLLNTMFPQLFGKKYVALGDSLTNGTGAKPYCQVAAEYFGMNLINYGIISSTLAEYDEAGGGYEPMSVRYADMDADAEVVTIMGGTNDIYSKIGTMSDRQENGQFTLYSGAHKLFKGIMEKYPNAKVGVILPPQFAKCLPTDTEGNGPDINLEKHQARLAAIKEVAEFYSLPVLDLCHHGGINGYGAVQRELFFQADKLHLTTAGQARLAEKVIAWMKNL